MCVGICGEECPKLCRVCDEDAEEFSGYGPQAMFVELVDCGHVFEVKTLDQWMDESDVEEVKHKEVEIRYKKCPKCNTPILANNRYGNIIKKLLADFEAVKRQIVLSDVADSSQIQRILEEAQEINWFKTEVQEIVQSITQGQGTSEEVIKRQNQVILLKFLDSTYSILKKHSSFITMKKQGLDKTLQNKIHFLKSRVMKRRDCFSEQEINELIEELSRTKLLVCFEVLMTFLEHKAITLTPEDASRVNSIRSALESVNAIGRCSN